MYLSCNHIVGFLWCLLNLMLIKRYQDLKFYVNSTLKNKNKSIKSFGMFGNHYHCNFFFLTWYLLILINDTILNHVQVSSWNLKFKKIIILIAFYLCLFGIAPPPPPLNY